MMTALGHFITGTHMVVEVKQEEQFGPPILIYNVLLTNSLKRNMFKIQMASSRSYDEIEILMNVAKNLTKFKKKMYSSRIFQPLF